MKLDPILREVEKHPEKFGTCPFPQVAFLLGHARGEHTDLSAEELREAATDDYCGIDVLFEPEQAEEIWFRCYENGYRVALTETGADAKEVNSE